MPASILLVLLPFLRLQEARHTYPYLQNTQPLLRSLLSLHPLRPHPLMFSHTSELARCFQRKEWNSCADGRKREPSVPLKAQRRRSAIHVASASPTIVLVLLVASSRLSKPNNRVIKTGRIFAPITQSSLLMSLDSQVRSVLKVPVLQFNAVHEPPPLMPSLSSSTSKSCYRG